MSDNVSVSDSTLARSTAALPTAGAKMRDTFRRRSTKLAAYSRARRSGDTIVASAAKAGISIATANRWERRDREADERAEKQLASIAGVPSSKAEILQGLVGIAKDGETASARLGAWQALAQHLGFNDEQAKQRRVPESVGAWLDAQAAEASCPRCASGVSAAENAAAPSASVASST